MHFAIRNDLRDEHVRRKRGVPAGVLAMVGKYQHVSPPPPVCASPDTPIATPNGERPIADIRVGDIVYTVDDHAIRAVAVAKVRRQSVEHHHVVRVVTSAGAPC